MAGEKGTTSVVPFCFIQQYSFYNVFGLAYKYLEVMKRSLCFITLISCLALASCNSSADNNTEAVEEKEDRAAEAADEMEEAAEEQDTSAVQTVQ